MKTKLKFSVLTGHKYTPGIKENFIRRAFARIRVVDTNLYRSYPQTSVPSRLSTPPDFMGTMYIITVLHLGLTTQERCNFKLFSSNALKKTPKTQSSKKIVGLCRNGSHVFENQ